jgi:lipooligosaccharide transport system permease protein
VRPLIEALPLYQSIQLLRDPSLGTFHWGMLVAALYLLAFGSIGLAIATRRLGRKLLL